MNFSRCRLILALKNYNDNELATLIEEEIENVGEHEGEIRRIQRLDRHISRSSAEI